MTHPHQILYPIITRIFKGVIFSSSMSLLVFTSQWSCKIIALFIWILRSYVINSQIIKTFNIIITRWLGIRFILNIGGDFFVGLIFFLVLLLSFGLVLATFFFFYFDLYNEKQNLNFKLVVNYPFSFVVCTMSFYSI